MFGKQRCQVLVVGAGPVGLYTALRLARAGVDVQIVDKHRRTGAHSYALALHGRSLRLLDEVDVTSDLLERGRRIERLAFHADGQARGKLSFDALGGEYPFVLALPQSALELALEQKLESHKVRVQWNRRLEGLREEDSRLVCNLSLLDQVASGYPIARVDWAVIKTSRVHSDFLVGADGYQSKVRSELELTLERLEEFETFAVYEFESPSDPGHEIRVLLDGGLTSAFWPMGPERARWSFQIARPEEYVSSREGLSELVRARAPGFPQPDGALYWSSICQFDKRLVSRLGRGRVWLAGDAAHLTGPVGAQSMNAGLADAFELTELLPEMLRRPELPNLLESYEKQRLRELNGLFLRGQVLQATSERGAWAEPLAAKVLSCIPATGGDLGRLLEQLDLEIQAA